MRNILDAMPPTETVLACLVLSDQRPGCWYDPVYRSIWVTFCRCSPDASVEVVKRRCFLTVATAHTFIVVGFFSLSFASPAHASSVFLNPFFPSFCVSVVLKTSPSSLTCRVAVIFVRHSSPAEVAEMVKTGRLRSFLERHRFTRFSQAMREARKPYRSRKVRARRSSCTLSYIVFRSELRSYSHQE